MQQQQQNLKGAPTSDRPYPQRQQDRESNGRYQRPLVGQGPRDFRNDRVQGSREGGYNRPVFKGDGPSRDSESRLNRTGDGADKGDRVRQERSARRPPSTQQNGGQRRADGEKKRSEPNVIFVRDRPLSFYVFLSKQLFHKDNYDEVALHAVGGESIFSAIRVAELLTRHGYATMARVKTQTAHTRGERGERDTKAAKLIIKMAKTAEFNQLYERFEKQKEENPRNRGEGTRTYSRKVQERSEETKNKEAEEADDEQQQESKKDTSEATEAQHD